MIKVLLVDDHELVRTGIESLLNASSDISVIGVANCGEDAVEVIDQLSPDVVLMDINMPGMGGKEACRRLLQHHPEIKIIALSVLNDGPIPEQILNMGVQGFITKSSTVIEMVNAIKRVMDGKRFLCSDVANNLALSNLKGNDKSPFSKLSRRESEVVAFILQGKSIKEMSDLLVISDKTINTYRYRVYEKLNIKNDVELTRMAVKFDYIDSALI